eukprot:365893-Chlamydomonas_euryale.AAC.7
MPLLSTGMRLTQIKLSTPPTSHQPVLAPYTSPFSHLTPARSHTLHQPVVTPHTSPFSHPTPACCHTSHQPVLTPYTSLLSHLTPAPWVFGRQGMVVALVQVSHAHLEFVDAENPEHEAMNILRAGVQRGRQTRSLGLLFAATATTT